MIWNLLLDAAQDAAGTEGTGTPENQLGTIIMLIVFAVVLVGMFVWQTISNKKKQKEAAEMVDSLKVGDKVKTIGGICGYVAQIDNNENTFVLETGMNGQTCYVKFTKEAIYQTAPGNAPASAPAQPEVKEEKVEEKKEPAKRKPRKKAEPKQEETAEPEQTTDAE